MQILWSSLDVVPRAYGRSSLVDPDLSARQVGIPNPVLQKFNVIPLCSLTFFSVILLS